MEALEAFKILADNLLVVAAVIISFAIAVPQFVIERNNCTGGKANSEKTMSYNNGKIDFNSSQYTYTGLKCKD